MTAIEIHYSRLPDEIELIDRHPSRAQEFPPELMLEIFKMAGVTYGILNRRWYARYLEEESRSLWGKLIQWHPVRVLFPDLTPKKARFRACLENLNARIDQLYAVIYTGPGFQGDVERKFAGVNKILCEERFEAHIKQLVRLVLDRSLFHNQPSDAACGACVAGVCGAFSIGTSVWLGLLKGPSNEGFIIMCGLASFSTLMTLREIIHYRTYKTPLQRIEALLQLPLEEVRARLAPSFQRVADDVEVVVE